MYYAGCDQFNFLGDVKASNVFVPTKSDLNYEDLIVDWDGILFSEIVDKVKVWYFKTVSLQKAVQVYPARCLPPHDCRGSKAVLAGRTIFILDCGRLFSVDVTQLFDAAPDSVLSVIGEVTFRDESRPDIVDISSCGKHCFAVDTTGGFYKVPDLLFRREDLVIRRLYSGFAFHLALSDTGAVYSWGNGSRGELGRSSDSIECEMPQRIEFFDDLPSVVVDLACGGWHALALTSDGDVYSWGWNEGGQLGHSEEKLSSVSPHPFPVDLGSADDPVCQVAAGARHSIALLQSGQLYSWGMNKFGQLAVGDNDNRMTPTLTKDNWDTASVQRVHCGRWTTVVRTVPHVRE